MPYEPSRAPQITTLEELQQYLMQELELISREQNETLALDLRPVYREPERPREGMIVSADGTSWNPGSGAGAYEYVGGTWVKL